MNRVILSCRCSCAVVVLLSILSGGCDSGAEGGSPTSEVDRAASPLGAVGQLGTFSGEAATGRYHTCWLNRTDGTVVCRGRNDDGQLGTGGGTSSVPAAVATTEKFVSVAAGDTHTCALEPDGTVWCWGLYGSAFSPTPVQIVGLTASQISASGGHTCALTEDRRIACWGLNTSGQLGNGTVSPFSSPTYVLDGGESPGTTRYLAVVAGPRNSCGLTSRFEVLCWGDNSAGQVSSPPAPTPETAPVVVASSAQDIAVGHSHLCVLQSDAKIFCQGDSTSNRLGKFAVPTALSTSGAEPIALSAGHDHTCALTTHGTVRCWGANDRGQSGNPSVPVGVDRSAAGGSGVAHMSTGEEAVKVAGLTGGAYDLTSGPTRSCAVTQEGVRCWGDIDDLRRDASLQWLGSAASAIDVDFDLNFACAVNGADQVVCWGGAGARLGNLDAAERYNPIAVVGLGDAGRPLSIDVGRQHACVLDDLGDLYCWGNNDHGQLGFDTSGLPSEAALAHSGVVGFGAGGNTTCAALTSGAVVCWGEDASTAPPGEDPVPGEGLRLGVGSGPVPNTVLAGPGTFVRVSVAAHHACASTDDSQVFCWGRNHRGQAGVDRDVSIVVNTPTPVAGLPSPTPATAYRPELGENHTCAIEEGESHSDTSIFCWGTPTKPVIVPLNPELEAFGISGAGDLAATWNKTCAVASLTSSPGRGVYCWSPGGVPVEESGLQASEAGALGVAAGLACMLDPDSNFSCVGRINLSSERALMAQATGLRWNASGTEQLRTSPRPLVGAVETVSTRSGSCELTTLGTVRCWGRRANEQFFGADIVEGWQEGGILLSSPQRIVAIAAGESHWCGVFDNGEVRCWGSNNSGQAAPAEVGVYQKAPALVLDASKAAYQVVAGEEHSCAITTDGVECWGNPDATCGSTSDVTTVSVGPPSPFTMLEAGAFHTCVVSGVGATCWGRNESGQVNGTAPTFIVGMPPEDCVPPFLAHAGPVADLSADRDSSCFVDPTGLHSCIGSSPAFDGASGIAKTVAVDEVRCVSSLSGDLTCNGRLNYSNDAVINQPYAGTLDEDRLITVAPSWFTASESVPEAHRYHLCGQSASGSRVCWGRAQQSTGTTNTARVGSGVGRVESLDLAEEPGIVNVRNLNFPYRTPRVVSRRRGPRILLSGNDGTALVSGSQAAEWGDHALWNSAASGAPAPSATNVSARSGDGGGDLETLRPGPDFLAETYCVVTPDSRVRCWGYRVHASLGDGVASELSSEAAVDFAAGSAHMQVSVGERGNTCVLSSVAGVGADNVILCAGRNDDGRLAPLGSSASVTDASGRTYVDGTVLAPTSPFNPVHVSFGFRHGCFVVDDGRVACFGDNSASQYGTPSAPPGPALLDPPPPREVVRLVDGSELRDVVELEAGNDVTCARTAQGRVFCWGDPRHPFVDTSLGAEELGISGPVARIAVANDHGLAVAVGDAAYRWGLASSNVLPGPSFSGLPEPVVYPPLGAIQPPSDVSTSETGTCFFRTGGALRCYATQAANEGREDACFFPGSGCADVIY